jgi:flagellar biosynthetic protein FliR
MNADKLLASFGEQQVAAFMLVLARVSPLFVLAPLFSSKLVPLRARGIVAVALAIGIAPIALNAGGADGMSRIPLDALTFGGLILKEILVGMAFSFAVGVLFAALTTAGAIVDMLVGFSFGSLVDPLTGNQGGILNQVYSMVGLLIFVVTNGDAWVIEGLARTYDAVPLVDAPEIKSLVGGAQLAFSGILAAAVQICAPVILAMLLTDVAFGLVAKMMPQLNVFAVGFPTKVLVGVLVVGASLPLVGNWMGDELQRSVAMALRSLQVAG